MAKLSAAGRKAISRAQKARWARVKAGKTTKRVKPVNHMANYMRGAIALFDADITKKGQELADVKELRDAMVKLDRIAASA